MEFLKKRTHLFAGILIVVLGTIIYSNTFNSEFQFDDGVHILKDNNLNNLSSYSKLETWTNIHNRPLSYFALAFNKKLSGESVFGYHLFNLIIHLITSILVYFLSLLIIKQIFTRHEKIRAYPHLFALFIAFVFLCHPIQTQAVTYVVQRMTSMSALFYLGSVFFYLKVRLSFLSNRKLVYSSLYFFVMIVTGVASLLSKQIAVTLPLAYLLVEFYFIRKENGKRFNKYLISVSIAIGLLILIFVIAGYLPKETSEISRYQYFSTQQRVILKYVQLLVIPISQNLDYEFTISSSLWGIDELTGLFVILSLLVSIFTLYRKYPLISFGIAWFFISLLLESSVIPIRDVIFEHRLYLPMFGFSIAFGAFLFEFLKTVKERHLKMAFAIVIILLGSLTYARNIVWKNNYNLWYDVVQKSPNKLRPRLNLGVEYLQMFKAKKAIEQFNIAEKIDPENWQVYYNRSEAFLMMDQTENAIKDLNESIRLNPRFAESFDARGRAKLRIRKFDDALADFSKAIEINPKFESAWFNRSNAFLFLGKIDQALKDVNQSIELNSDFAAAYNNRGQINLNLKNYQEAIVDLSMAISIEPKLISAYNNRAKALFQLADYELAIKDLNKSLVVGQEDGNVFKLRGESYLKLGFFKEALVDLQRAKSMGIQIDEAIIESCRNEISSHN